MRYLDFPSQDEWKRIFKTSPFEQFASYMRKLDEKNRNEPRPGILGLPKRIEILELTRQLAHRLDDVIKSYVMLVYYYDKGIPDENWYSEDGEYFPDFNQVHFYVKEWFDYYSDVFYYKLFSAWDLVGHILDVKYDLKVEEKGKKVGFHSAVNALNQKDNSLYSRLDNIRNHPEFKKASEIRNNITHNYLPSSIGLGVNITETGVTVGLRQYITSDEIINNVRETIGLLEQTLLHISS